MNNDLIKRVLGEKGSAEFENKLKMFSVSDIDAQFRRKAFAKTIENTLDINAMVMGGKRGRNSFAGASVSSANLAGVSIYAGVMRSFVQSIAPIFAVQRNIDAPQQKVMYVDFYDILGDGSPIVSNIGPDKAWADAKNRIRVPLTSLTNDTITVTTSNPIIPKTFKAEVYNSSDQAIGVIYDNGSGRFMTSPGVLEADGATEAAQSTVTYKSTGDTGSFKLIFPTGTTASYMIYSCIFDVTNRDEVNKSYGMTKYYDVETSPVLIPVERNVISDHAMAKQGIINADELYSNFVENEYTKVINLRVVDAICNNYTGDTYNLDLSGFTLAAGYYETIVRSFRSLLTQAENQLAAQTYKGAKCTGYLATPGAVNMFDLMVAGDGWVKNVNSTYYKDIVGWYNDVPVVRTTVADSGLTDGDVILTHRTDDGYVAPLFHGMFLAPTELPVVANYQNMTKYAAGMYSMEGFGFSSSALCVKVHIIAPNDLKLTIAGA